MIPWLRNLGLGRVVYHAWHRPKAMIAESIRQGGPREQWRTERGRREMEAAAHRLPPLAAPPETTPTVTVHVLTGRKLWYQTAFMLHSLARFQPVRVRVHDDGTLNGNCLESLRRVVPWAHFIGDAETVAILDRVLPTARYPTLRSRRSETILFRKIMDIHAGARGWNLFLDSDMLFFRPPTRLSEWLAGPAAALHMTDVERSYGYEMDLLAELAGRPVPDLVNTGILGLRSERVDWDRAESDCRTLTERAGRHYYQEQALTALILAAQPCAALPRPDYLVLPQPPEALDCRAVVHHYVAGSKKWYFRHNWRKFATNA